MDFNKALALLKEGKAVKRPNWAEDQKLILAEHISYKPIGKSPVIVEKQSFVFFVPDAIFGWQPTAEDILAEDWQEA